MDLQYPWSLYLGVRPLCLPTLWTNELMIDCGRGWPPIEAVMMALRVLTKWVYGTRTAKSQVAKKARVAAWMAIKREWFNDAGRMRSIARYREVITKITRQTARMTAPALKTSVSLLWWVMVVYAQNERTTILNLDYSTWWCEGAG